MLDERMKQFEEEKVKWEQQRQAAAQAGKAFDDAEPTMDEERERAWQVWYVLIHVHVHKREINPAHTRTVLSATYHLVRRTKGERERDEGWGKGKR